MSNEFEPLWYNTNGKFKIMVVGDIHEKYLADEKTEDFLRLINKTLDELKPDLVVLMGDLVSSHFTNGLGESQDLNVSQMREEIQRIVAPFAARNLPLASVFGNHDGEKGLPKEVILSLLQEYSNFRTIDTEGLTGCGNCNLLIKSSNGTNDVFNIWLIDSGNKAPKGRGDDAYVETDQIEWYESEADKLKANNGGEPLPAIVFQHIPVLEEYRLLKRTTRLNPHCVRGNSWHSKNFYVIADRKNTPGYIGEGPCTPDYDNGQFKSWKKQGDVIGAFFGHDHMNDFCGQVDGITLGQCKCTGFHIYGDGLRQGVRLITLDEKRPGTLATEMHYYRDYFGTKCNSIKGIDLISDRRRINGKIAMAALGSVAAISVLGIIVKKLVD